MHAYDHVGETPVQVLVARHQRRRGARTTLVDMRGRAVAPHAAGMLMDVDRRVVVGPTQRRIDGIHAVGGADDDDVFHANETVKQRNQLGAHADIGLRAALAAAWRDRVQFVHHHDRRAMLHRFFEDTAQIGLGAAMHRAHQLGTIDVEKVRADLVGNRFCQVCFADPWRSVK